MNAINYLVNGLLTLLDDYKLLVASSAKLGASTLQLAVELAFASKLAHVAQRTIGPHVAFVPVRAHHVTFAGLRVALASTGNVVGVRQAEVVAHFVLE